MITVVYTTEGDWVGFYDNAGDLAAEGHSFDESTVLRMAGIPHHLVYGVRVTNGGRLPKNISELEGGHREEVRP